MGRAAPAAAEVAAAAVFAVVALLRATSSFARLERKSSANQPSGSDPLTLPFAQPPVRVVLGIVRVVLGFRTCRMHKSGIGPSSYHQNALFPSSGWISFVCICSEQHPSPMECPSTLEGVTPHWRQRSAFSMPSATLTTTELGAA